MQVWDIPNVAIPRATLTLFLCHLHQGFDIGPGELDKPSLRTVHYSFFELITIFCTEDSAKHWPEVCPLAMEAQQKILNKNMNVNLK